MQYTTYYKCFSCGARGCLIRISKILLYAIHNKSWRMHCRLWVVLSGFQRYFCMQYTTGDVGIGRWDTLSYQDFKDTFVCKTQHNVAAINDAFGCLIRILKILLYAIHNRSECPEYQQPVVLSGFQRYFLYAIHNVLEHTDDHHHVVLSRFQRYFCMQYTTTSLP